MQSHAKQANLNFRQQQIKFKLANKLNKNTAKNTSSPPGLEIKT